RAMSGGRGRPAPPGRGSSRPRHLRADHDGRGRDAGADASLAGPVRCGREPSEGILQDARGSSRYAGGSRLRSGGVEREWSTIQPRRRTMDRQESRAMGVALGTGTGLQVAMVLAGHFSPTIAGLFAVAGMLISMLAGGMYGEGSGTPRGRAIGGGAVVGGLCALIGILVSVALG